jgi:hypothetical protein
VVIVARSFYAEMLPAGRPWRGRAGFHVKKIRAGKAPARKSGRAGEDRESFMLELLSRSAKLFSFIIMGLRAYRNARY